MFDCIYFLYMFDYFVDCVAILNFFTVTRESYDNRGNAGGNSNVDSFINNYVFMFTDFSENFGAVLIHN